MDIYHKNSLISSDRTELIPHLREPVIGDYIFIDEEKYIVIEIKDDRIDVENVKERIRNKKILSLLEKAEEKKK